MKTLLFASLLSVSCLVGAAGDTIDGFHECKLTYSGISKTVYLAFKAHPDGLTIWTIAAPNKTTVYGYGVGVYNAAAGTLSGVDDAGYQFNWQVNGTSISGMNTEKLGAAVVTYPIACTLIF